MLRSILVPIDGSPFSEQALPLALRLAARDGARVDLVMATEPPLPLDRVQGAPVFDPRLDQALRQEKAAYLTALAARIEREESVPTTATLREGPVAATLAARAGEGDVDLLVMTTHGRGGISRAWLGSVADALVRRVAVPVLLVRAREGGQRPAPVAVPPGRVLIPLNGFELGETILDDAIAIGGSMNVTYILARAVDPGVALQRTAEIVGFERDEAAERHVQASTYLDEVARRLSARGLKVETRVVSDQDPARAILECASDCGADLIAMATHARGGAERMIQGSIADSVARGASIPVLLRRPLSVAAAGGAGSHGAPAHRAG